MTKNGAFRATALIALMAGAVVFGMVLAGGLDLTTDVLASNRGSSSKEEPARLADPVALSAERQIGSFADLAEAVLPAVVTVRSTTVTGLQGGSQTDRFRFFSRPSEPEPRERTVQGVGSGFLISEDGWIVTNHHVIDGATKVEVTLEDKTLTAIVRGVDRSTDLAVLKVEGSGFPFLALGDSEELRVGDWVMAVGSPLGFGSSVTVGVVSAKGRVLPGLTGDRAFDDFIQTDAAINRGNSGGPLVNTHGLVIGVSTAMRAAAENIGFAVPSKILLDVIPQLQGEGKVARGYLGISIQDLDDELWPAFPGLTSSDGVLVNGIQAEPARRAGLEIGDVVVMVDGYPIKGTGELIDRVARHRPNERVELTLIRRGKRLTKTVILGDRESGLTRTPPPFTMKEEPSKMTWLGAVVQDLDRGLRERLSLARDVDGVVLTGVGPGSDLAQEGVQDYDVVLEVNGTLIDSVGEFTAEVHRVDSGGRVLLFIHSPSRGGLRSFLVVKAP